MASSSKGSRERGKAGQSGYRLLVAYRSEDRAVFLYGFTKSERDNIEDNELATLREIAAGWLEADDELLERAIHEGFLQEVSYDERNPKA